jgi:rRNA maturation RNase YbeY
MRDAKRGGESLNNAIDRLLIHGLLHLLGYDHERSEEEARRMEEETERLLAAFNL